MSNVALTINLPEDKQGFFCRVPLRMGKGRKMSPAARAIAGRIFGVTSKNERSSCWTSYDQLQDEFGVCRSTVASSIGALKNDDLIEEKARDRDGTAYRYVGNAGKRYNIVPLYLFTADITISGESCRLTKAQVLVLSHLMTECKRLKNNGKYEGSITTLSRELSLSETTVKKALKTLLKARLIYRPAEDKGVNSHKLTKYSVSKELFDFERKRKIRAKKEGRSEKTISDGDVRSERARYYDYAKQRTEDKAEKYLRQVVAAVPSFNSVNVELRAVEIAVAKAEVNDRITLPALLAKKKALEERRRAIVERYQIKEERFAPEYYAACKRCFDTGYQSDGRACSCYLRPKGGGRL